MTVRPHHKIFDFDPKLFEDSAEAYVIIKKINTFIGDNIQSEDKSGGVGAYYLLLALAAKIAYIRVGTFEISRSVPLHPEEAAEALVESIKLFEDKYTELMKRKREQH